MSTIKSFSFSPDQLTIDWENGLQSKLATIWLRDHCQMAESRDVISGQRLMNISDIPEEVEIDTVTRENDSLIIRYHPDQYCSRFSNDWIFQNCYCINSTYDDRSEKNKRLWQGDSFATGIPQCNFDDFSNRSEVKLSALQAVRDYGFVLLNAVEPSPAKVLDVIKEFGFVRQTNYGKLFDVRATVDASNLAFTNRGLGCHLDNPYRDPVPGLQLLHCLESSTEGGETILQDGFMAAAVLRAENPDHFSLLCKQWINFKFQDSASNLKSRVAFIEVNDHDEVIKVRFNNRSIDTINLAPDLIRSFYQAYRHYAEILERETLQISFKLEAGQLILFDNTRILHARKSYSSAGHRHLQGAYSDLDGLYSTLYQLEQKL
ncbi:MAG: gamma-butyrobetaine hydroxylase [Planctomycetota bacterium]|jgi:gamma-butyrobetaine hydroxylase